MNADEWWALIGRGKDGWNEWRTQNPDVRVDLRGLYLKDESLSGYDLREANLRGASLRGAWLDDAKLQDADLRDAHLTIAKLQGADLTGADLRGAQLNNAILRGATLFRVDLSGAILRGADFEGALLGWTVFGYTDLHNARNLNKAKVKNPISIGLDTLQLSRWQVPRNLLSNPKLHPDVIASVERWAGKPDVFDTCFLSHSSSDRKLVSKLYDELRSDGVACWYSGEDLPPGTLWKEQLVRNLMSADRVLVLVTPRSLKSDGVRDEMNKVLEEGPSGMARIVPIKLLDDESWKASEVPWLVEIRNSIQAVDFGVAGKSYGRYYLKLLEALKKHRKDSG